MPQRGDEGLEFALDIGEGDAIGSVLDRVQRLRVEQCEESQAAFGIVFGGANSAECPGLERAKIEAIEYAPGALEQQADGFRRRFGDAPDHPQPFGKALRRTEPARSMLMPSSIISRLAHRA